MKHIKAFNLFKCSTCSWQKRYKDGGIVLNGCDICCKQILIGRVAALCTKLYYYDGFKESIIYHSRDGALCS